MKHLLVAATVTATAWLATPAWANPFFFSTGAPDGLVGTLSQPAAAGTLETETADDFILTEATSIAGATITGLIPPGTPLTSIGNVEVEVYHVFSKDSAVPPSGRVPLRLNSPADVEIDSATRSVFASSTNAPPIAPTFTRMSPRASSTRRASRTVIRDTPNCSASSRSDCRRSPARSSPAKIARSIWETISPEARA